jgi:hypothetical protein
MSIEELFKTKEYRFIFHIEAKKIGSIAEIGIYSTYRDAETLEDAKRLLRDEFECIHISSVTKKDIK